MASTFRIPKAELSGVKGRLMAAYSRRTFGQVADGLYVMNHHPQLMNTIFRFEGRVAKWKALDADLKSYAQLASAAVIGCSWCLDFGYFMSHHDGLDEAKVREVPRWHESEVFDARERRVLAYAEAMSVTPLEVTDEMVADLVADLGAKAVVELTQMIALENMRSRFNSAAGLASQGFSDVCELPLAPVSARDGREGGSGHERRRDRHLRRPPQPAVHRRLRDARLRGRCGGRAPGGLAALGRGQP